MSHFTCSRCDHFFSRNDAIETPTTKLFDGIHDRPATREYIIVLLCPYCLSNRLEPCFPCANCKKHAGTEDDLCDGCAKNLTFIEANAIRADAQYERSKAAQP